MAHAYRIRSDNPPDTDTETLREQALAQLDTHQRTLVDQETPISERRGGDVTDRPEHLHAVHRFAEDDATHDQITTTATQMLGELPVNWWVLEYHQCPAALQASSGSDCPDWQTVATGGTPPEALL